MIAIVRMLYTIHIHACCMKEVYARSYRSAGWVMYFARNFAPLTVCLCGMTHVSALLPSCWLIFFHRQFWGMICFYFIFKHQFFLGAGGMPSIIIHACPGAAPVIWKLYGVYQTLLPTPLSQKILCKKSTYFSYTTVIRSQARNNYRQFSLFIDSFCPPKKS